MEEELGARFGGGRGGRVGEEGSVRVLRVRLGRVGEGWGQVAERCWGGWEAVK